MANRHPSAIKRNRQNEKRAERNASIRSRLRTDIRKVREAVSSQDVAAAEAGLKLAVKEIDKAATKGVLHRNAAARRISRLSKHVHALKSAS